MGKRGPRKVYNYEYIIHDWQLDEDFNIYCSHHQNVRSLRRLARSFLLKLGLRFQLPCYELGFERPYLQWVHEQAQAGLINYEM